MAGAAYIAEYAIIVGGTSPYGVLLLSSENYGGDKGLWLAPPYSVLTRHRRAQGVCFASRRASSVIFFLLVLRTEYRGTEYTCRPCQSKRLSLFAVSRLDRVVRSIPTHQTIKNVSGCAVSFCVLRSACYVLRSALYTLRVCILHSFTRPVHMHLVGSRIPESLTAAERVRSTSR
jgi:hypothetical protein